MDELADAVKEPAEGKGWGWLGRAIPITLAVFAVCMALSKILDDNIVQDIVARNQQRASLWALYDETSIKEKLYGIGREELEIQLATAQASREPAFRQELEKKHDEFHELEEYYTQEKDHLRTGKENTTPRALAKRREKAKSQEISLQELDRIIDRENRQDDWFDRSDAAFSMALAFLATCAALRSIPLYLASLFPGTLGLVFMLCGYFLPGLR